MGWLDILRARDKESTVEEMAAAHVDLEHLHEELSEQYRAVYVRLIEFQQNALAGGSDKEVKAARVELLDLEEKLEAAASGQRTLRARMAEKLRATKERRLKAEIPMDLEKIRNETKENHYEFLKTLAKAAVILEKNRGCTGLFSRLSAWTPCLPMFEILQVGSSSPPTKVPAFLSPDEAEVYQTAIENFRAELGVPRSLNGNDTQGRESNLQIERRNLEEYLAKFTPETAVIPLLKAAGSRFEGGKATELPAAEGEAPVEPAVSDYSQAEAARAGMAPARAEAARVRTIQTPQYVGRVPALPSEDTDGPASAPEPGEPRPAPNVTT